MTSQKLLVKCYLSKSISNSLLHVEVDAIQEQRQRVVSDSFKANTYVLLQHLLQLANVNKLARPVPAHVKKCTLLYKKM
jgi:hypothetical protein